MHTINYDGRRRGSTFKLSLRGFTNFVVKPVYFILLHFKSPYCGRFHLIVLKVGKLATKFVCYQSSIGHKNVLSFNPAL